MKDSISLMKLIFSLTGVELDEQHDHRYPSNWLCLLPKPHFFFWLEDRSFFLRVVMSSIFYNYVHNRLVLPQATKLTICFKKTIKEGEPRQGTRLLTLGWEVHFSYQLLTWFSFRWRGHSFEGLFLRLSRSGKLNINWFPLNGWMFCMKLITYYLTWQIVVSTVMTEKQYKTVVVAYSSDSYSLGPDLTKSCYLTIKQLFIGEANKSVRPCFT